MNPVCRDVHKSLEVVLGGFYIFQAFIRLHTQARRVLFLRNQKGEEGKMKRLRVFALISLFLLLFSPNLTASGILIWDPHSSPDVYEYQNVLEGIGYSTIITDDLVTYVHQHGLDDIDAIFAILAYDLLEFPEAEAEILIDFLNLGGGVYIEGRYFYHERLNQQYLHVDWTTCEPWKFKSFRGVVGTFMHGLYYSFPDTVWSSTMEPFDGGAEVIFEDDVLCGCVTSATTNPDIKAVVSSQPVMRVVEDEPPNTKEEILRRIAEWLGVFLGAEEEEPERNLPRVTRLTNNFPNPFNSSTSIQFHVRADQPRPISLKIYNLAGQLVRTVTTQRFSSGDYTLSWDGKGEAGGDVSSGIYFCKLTSLDHQSVLRMTLLR
jgi:hypothetical protein